MIRSIKKRERPRSDSMSNSTNLMTLAYHHTDLFSLASFSKDQLVAPLLCTSLRDMIDSQVCHPQNCSFEQKSIPSDALASRDQRSLPRPSERGGLGDIVHRIARGCLQKTQETWEQRMQGCRTTEALARCVATRRGNGCSSNGV